MEITVKINSAEARDIVKKNVLNRIPVDTTNHNVSVIGSYSEFTVTITEKKEEQTEEVE